ncbi:hypothetical protein IOQ59_11475 [Pontibacterium sp. N1Y112]|uniref:Uncharacterized protein n=1 Tax=Pontibacterium sinense TaxID=2781979 RepID=A0A8J7JYQ6_9GAMM|nr:restriction endonuclease [Pontibacterium sinense]MBE9397878.1 hypothetical protein [Pontibacterium sinense]
MKESILIWHSKHSAACGTAHTDPYCIWCDSKILWDAYGTGKSSYYFAMCPLCGWKGVRAVKEFSDKHVRPIETFKQTYLRDLDFKPDNPALVETRAYFDNNTSNMLTMPWGEVENSVKHIYLDTGYDIQLTAKTKDDSSNLVLLNNGERTEIITCRKQENEKIICIENPKRLIGICIDWNVKKVAFVTTSETDTTISRNQENYFNTAHIADFSVASELLSELSSYNKNLPCLDAINKKQTNEIIENNTHLFDISRPNKDCFKNYASPLILG